MTDKEMLSSLKVLYGENVMCTNGLYHILNDRHEENYINPETKEVDTENKYCTVVVTDKVILARTINASDGTRFVILDKSDLSVVHRSQGLMYYLDDNLLLEYEGNITRLFSHTGIDLYELSDVQSVDIISNSKYLVKSKNAFSDIILIYRKQLDLLTNIVRKQKYSIFMSNTQEETVEVISMKGGKYIFDFKNNKCINDFTGKVESIQLFEFG